jgi:hypothetical protein
MKMKNDYDKYKLLTTVIKNEHFIYYLQTMDYKLQLDNDGNIIKDDDNEWIFALQNLMIYIQNRIVSFRLMIEHLN